jgi:hypothetical protein
MAKTLAKKFASVARAREIDEQSQSSFKQSNDNAREGWREMDFFRESVSPLFFTRPQFTYKQGDQIVRIFAQFQEPIPRS